MNEDLSKAMKWAPLFAMERAGLRVLTIPQLKAQLAGKKDDAAIMFFDWHHKGGEMSFPTELKTVPLDNYKIVFHNWVGSKPSIEGKELQGGKMIMFNTEGLPTFGRTYRDDVKPGAKSLPLPKHLTVADFKNTIAGLDEKAFFAVKHHGKNFVSPDLLMNYNAATYPLVNNKKQLVASHLGMEGDILCFGLGSTMSTDWGPFTFSLEPRTTEEINENFIRQIVRDCLK